MCIPLPVIPFSRFWPTGLLFSNKGFEYYYFILASSKFGTRKFIFTHLHSSIGNARWTARTWTAAWPDSAGHPSSERKRQPSSLNLPNKRLFLHLIFIWTRGDFLFYNSYYAAFHMVIFTDFKEWVQGIVYSTFLREIALNLTNAFQHEGLVSLKKQLSHNGMDYLPSQLFSC